MLRFRSIRPIVRATNVRVATSCHTIIKRNISSINQSINQSKLQNVRTLSSFINNSINQSKSQSNDTVTAATSEYKPLSLAVGSKHHNFTVKSATPVQDFNLTVYHLTHDVTGADYYHIDRDDSDSTFAVSFKTPVSDSTGVAHILEHTALCGSTKFPVRDPFFTLLRRSLKTYMNAMTAQNYTMYPFSTQNERDFHNLLSVYLDAAFQPLLREPDFRQEGHRLELVPATESSESNNQSNDQSNNQSNDASKDSKLVFKGVVFNEMKGAMSDTHQLFAQRLQSLIFNDPKNVYHHNSGGEPAVIPDLTHEQLVQFHRRFYSPENACFFSYGHITPPFAESDSVIQSVLASRAAANAGANDSAKYTQYHPQPTSHEAVTHYSTCPPDPMTSDENKQTKTATSFVLDELSKMSPKQQILEFFSLSILSSLLLDGPMSPFYQKLIESGLGHSYAPGTGFDGDSYQPTFTVGVQGCSDAEVPQVNKIIDEVLIKHSKEGFDMERVEAMLHQIEIGVKHVSSQFGIGLMMRMMSQWALARDPLATLHINEKIEFIREAMKDPNYFQSLIQKHLLSNRHRVTLVMTPDADYAARENEAEAKRLAAIEAKLTETDRERINREAEELRTMQDKFNDPSCLPSLSVADIKREAEHVNLKQLPSKTPNTHIDVPLTEDPKLTTQVYQVPVFALEAATNGCAYFRLVYDMKSLPVELRPFASIFTSFFTEIGTGALDYRALTHTIELRTGGISASMKVFNDRNDNMLHQELLLIRGMSLERNVPHLMDLTRDLITAPVWRDLPRLKQLIVQSAASLSSGMQDSGHSYARSVAAATLSPSAAVNEQLGGISHVTMMNELASKVSQDEQALIALSEKLAAISDFLQLQGPTRAMIVGDQPSLYTLESNLRTFMDSVTHSAKNLSPAAVSESWKLPSFEPATKPSSIFYALPIAVNNASLVLPTVSHSHPDCAALTVGAKLMSSVFVHREVREKGGAYGGGAGHGDGLFSFYSFRDPNHTCTLDAFERGLNWLAQSTPAFSSSDVEEALLSLFSSIDAPTPPSQKGIGQFVSGITYEERQRHRDQLLAVKSEDIIRVANQYLTNPKQRAQVCVVGAETMIPESSSTDRMWEVRKLELPESTQEDQMEMDDEKEEGRKIVQ